MLRTFAGAALAALLAVTALAVRSTAQDETAITIWKVGSPYTGEIPHTRMPAALAGDAARRGWSLHLAAFPAQGFAARFAAAARSGSAPDVVVFDNFGIMNGASTPRGTFVGIGADPAVRKQLVPVTTSFDDILLPARGWAFLFKGSSHHARARELAARTPRCADPSSAASLPKDLAVPQIAAAYLTGDNASMRRYAEDQRLANLPTKVDPRSGLASISGAVKVGKVAVCGGWGNDRLVVVTANASYQSDTAVGHAPLVLVLQQAEGWQLLAAARDPVTNRDFVARLFILSDKLERELPLGAAPVPAVLRSPDDGRFPVPGNGARFGDFEWQTSPSPDVVAEIAEFRYADDARLFLLRPPRPGVTSRVSTGLLWSTGGTWAWRVWSITRAGEVTFSDVRTFMN